MPNFERITFDPNILGGRACIRGRRISVSLVVNLLANDMTVHQVLQEYPDLEQADIQAALRYVAWLAEDSVYVPEKVMA